MPNSTIAALCLLAASTGGAWAAAARVDFAYGDVTVAGPGGAERPLVRGAELENNDVVRTAEGRAQLRFSDGAYVSLQPHSEFAIRDYRFNGKTDGAERGFFALTRGAMRTVTGLIGRVNRERYKVDTPTATIGIRGTGGVIQVLDDGSTLIVGTSGIWSLTNAAGTVEVPAGVSALSPATQDAPPRETSRQPQAGPAPVATGTAFAQGEQRGPAGGLAALGAPSPGGPAVLTSGAGYAAVLAYGRVTDGFFPRLDGGPDVGALFDASGRLVQASLASTLYRLEGTHADFGTDGLLAWGRWTGKVSAGTLTETYSDNQGLHYVIGIPTPALPTSGRASYSLAGATRPTYLGGGVAAGTFSGALDVVFGPSPTVSTVNWQVAMPDRTYLIGDTSMPAQPGGFSASGISTLGCASAPCTSAISGFFAGPGAERIGAGYQITDGLAGPAGANNVVGAAAFKKQP